MSESVFKTVMEAVDNEQVVEVKECRGQVTAPDSQYQWMEKTVYQLNDGRFCEIYVNTGAADKPSFGRWLDQDEIESLNEWLNR